MNLIQERIILKVQKNIKLIRQATGLSQGEMADRIGVSRQTINTMENKKSPSVMSGTIYVAIGGVLDLYLKERVGLIAVVEAILSMNDTDPDIKVIVSGSFIGGWLAATPIVKKVRRSL